MWVRNPPTPRFRLANLLPPSSSSWKRGNEGGPIVGGCGVSCVEGGGRGMEVEPGNWKVGFYKDSGICTWGVVSCVGSRLF